MSKRTRLQSNLFLSLIVLALFVVSQFAYASWFSSVDKSWWVKETNPNYQTFLQGMVIVEDPANLFTALVSGNSAAPCYYLGLYSVGEDVGKAFVPEMQKNVEALATDNCPSLKDALEYRKDRSSDLKNVDFQKQRLHDDSEFLKVLLPSLRSDQAGRLKLACSIAERAKDLIGRMDPGNRDTILKLRPNLSGLLDEISKKACHGEQPLIPAPEFVPSMKEVDFAFCNLMQQQLVEYATQDMGSATADITSNLRKGKKSITSKSDKKVKVWCSEVADRCTGVVDLRAFEATCK